MSHTHGVIRADGSLTVSTLEEWVESDDGVQYTTDNVAIESDPHNCQFASRPARGKTNAVRCWVIGDVYGYDTTSDDRSGEYQPRPPDTNAAQFCVSLYERYGLDFVSRLNGNFTLLVYDRQSQEISMCTDRFGTVPIYRTETDDGAIVFATNIQLLPSHPAVETSFHTGYLHEYLAFRRTFGVKTPLEGIEKLEPGSIMTISLVDGSRTAEQYWRPRYQPRDEPFEWFVEEFTDRFQTIVDEWTRDGHEYGVLLSGGSDSRLVLSTLGDATAFHMNDWKNREARIAERVATEADADFELLERGPQYRIGALERNRWASSFNGWFTQPYTGGFEDQITNRVDGLLSGLYGDSLFGGYSIPSPSVSLGPLGSMTIPFERSIQTVDEYVDLLVEDAHDGFDMQTDLRTVLNANISREGDRIVHHGVTYESLDELVYYGNCYPLSNDDDMRFRTALRQLLPYRSPFLDNRLLELSLSMPIRYRLRRNLVGQAVDRLAPDLASIPHASTGVGLASPFTLEYVSSHLHEFWDKHVRTQKPPEPYLTDGPWLDDAELLRSFGFANDVLDEQEPLADALPGPDVDSIREVYRDHHHGSNNVVELYTLLTVLTMPVTEHVLSTETNTALTETSTEQIVTNAEQSETTATPTLALENEVIDVV
ncbi:asparagine synthase-related protein [Halostagnicola bangensis]